VRAKDVIGALTGYRQFAWPAGDLVGAVRAVAHSVTHLLTGDARPVHIAFELFAGAGDFALAVFLVFAVFTVGEFVANPGVWYTSTCQQNDIFR